MVQVRVFSSSAHLLSPTRSTSEATLAVRQTLTTALSPSAHGDVAPSFSAGDVLTVPSIDVIAAETAALRQSRSAERAELDVTAKVFLPFPASSSASGLPAVEIALAELERLLGERERVDTLVLSWAGVAYEGEELGFFSGKPSSELIGANGGGGSAEVNDQALDSMVELWQGLPKLPALASASLGVTSFSQSLLARFLQRLPVGARPPVVNHLHLRDCCHVPQAYSTFARKAGVRLVSNSDPAVLVEADTVPAIFEPYTRTLKLPADASPMLEWTMKYTVLHKARGVLIDKGYILSTSWQP